MQPTAEQIRQLKAAILDAFDFSSLEQMVRLHLDVDLAHIVPTQGQNLTDISYQLVRYYAARPGGFIKLMRAALDANPGNSLLRDLWEQFGHIEFDVLPLSQPTTPYATVDTHGGSIVQGPVSAQGDFIGRDQIVQGDIVHGDKVTLYQVFQSAPRSITDYIRIDEFQPLVLDRTKRFVGREWVFDEIDRFLNDASFPSGYVFITGLAGTGKTALAAKLVADRAYVHHFNLGLQNVRSVADFLGNICAQLISAYRLNYAALPPEALQGSGFLSRLLSEVAADEINLPLIVLVDALDEADSSGLPPTANPLLLPPVLPQGVYILVTSRPEIADSVIVEQRRELSLDRDMSANLDDIRTYALRRITELRTLFSSVFTDWDVDSVEFADTIANNSEGNFMYAVQVLNDIGTGALDLGHVGDVLRLPRGLRAYYILQWRRMEADNSLDFSTKDLVVLRLLAAVREAVSTKQLAIWSELEHVEVMKIIGRHRAYLVEESKIGDASSYRIYHNSFQEFIVSEYGVRQAHEQIAEVAMSKIRSAVNG